MYDSLKDKQVDDAILKKEKVVEALKKIMPIEDDKIKWGDLCYFTKFDSTTTALACGLLWEENINIAKTSQLEMALYNMVAFPNDGKGNNSQKAGFGKSQKRIDFLSTYRGALNA